MVVTPGGQVGASGFCAPDAPVASGVQWRYWIFRIVWVMVLAALMVCEFA